MKGRMLLGLGLLVVISTSCFDNFIEQDLNTSTKLLGQWTVVTVNPDVLYYTIDTIKYNVDSVVVKKENPLTSIAFLPEDTIIILNFSSERLNVIATFSPEELDENNETTIRINDRLYNTSTPQHLKNILHNKKFSVTRLENRRFSGGDTKGELTIQIGEDSDSLRIVIELQKI